MNDFNVFSYIDFTFMHMFDEKLAHIRPLRAVDFEEEESKFGEYEPRERIQPYEDSSPPKLLVCIHLRLYESFCNPFSNHTFHLTEWKVEIIQERYWRIKRIVLFYYRRMSPESILPLSASITWI